VKVVTWLKLPDTLTDSITVAAGVHGPPPGTYETVIVLAGSETPVSVRLTGLPATGLAETVGVLKLWVPAAAKLGAASAATDTSPPTRAKFLIISASRTVGVCLGA